MKRSVLILSIILLIIPSLKVLSQNNYYYPERGVDWEEKDPSIYKIDKDKLQEAVAFAQENEYTGSRDLRQAILKGFEREPYHEILGPTKKRGGPAGMILKNGYVIAKWGDTKRVDMTFSVTKSYLSTVTGLAYDEGLIKSVKDRVNNVIWDGTFAGEHNSKITWEHLLNQSSDWSGQLFGTYDWGDRPARDQQLDDWRYRELHEPGTHFKYNDVRVNLLAYSLLNVWRKPLPQVLKEKVMDPIGATTTWRWYGYESSWVTIDGIKMQSVSGGGHSGGGIFINTEDHARFGLLFLSKGKWNNEPIISEDWIKLATTPSPSEKTYGYMWWLDTKDANTRMSHISDTGFYAAGFGGNYIIIEPELDLVIVTRWLEPAKANAFIKLVKDAL